MTLKEHHHLFCSHGPIKADEIGEIVTNSRIIAHCVRRSDAVYLVHCARTHQALVEALERFTDKYVSMVESGDCGNWDPEKEPEIIAVRMAQKAAQEVKL